jgi:diguanylate cyclase (GGDEF)-like protein
LVVVSDTSSSQPLIPIPRRWAFAELSRSAQMFLLGAESTALVLTISLTWRESLHTKDAVRLLLLAGLALGYAEATARIERVRRFMGSNRIWANHTSVWAVAAALVLPLGWAAALVALVYAHLLLIGRREHTIRPHRVFFTGATMILATIAAGAVADRSAVPSAMGGTLAAAGSVAGAAVVFALVNLAVVLTGIGLATRPARLSTLLPDRDTFGFEVSTILLGVITADFLVHSIWLTPLVVAVVAAVHRGSMVKQLRLAAATDAKTGLLNVATWRERAGQILSAASRNGGSVALAIIDLDHFKLVNDTYGHLAGDEVLLEVAKTLRREMREHDTLGRFGGEEFVVLLSGVEPAAARIVADRLCSRIAELTIDGGAQVSASIGLAYTAFGGAVRLDDLLQAADHALYGAKAAGRNRVHSTVVSPSGAVAEVDR